MSKTSSKRSFVLPTAEENRRTSAAARRDPDAQPLTARQLKAMAPLAWESWQLAIPSGTTPSARLWPSNTCRLERLATIPLPSVTAR